MTVPPYCSGWLITVALATSSDKRRERPGHLAFALGLGLVCFVILAATRNIKADYAAFFFLTGALCGAAPLALSWRTDHLSGSATHAAIATAAMVTFGNAGGIISGQIYPSSDGPTFRKGHIVNACFLTFGIGLTVLGAVFLPQVRRRDERLRSEKEEQHWPESVSVDRTHLDLAVGEGEHKA
ncbi:hypothetical protein HDU86_002991 [Geranomyces michiganensis]|nr:hypothetical protein HDU86_002991 [Geranomyces michiganensis]